MIAPYGSWRSPITADLIVAATIRLGAPALDGGDCYWLEGRPLDGGRTVLVRRSADGAVADVTPPGLYVRTLVHEYGGGACLVAGGVAYFVNYADQRIYRQPVGGEAHPLTPAGKLRYADMQLDAPRQRLLCVCEDHTAGGEPESYLAAVSLRDGAVTPLARGRTFYMAPRLSRDGARLAWLAWDHPHMPWDAAELWVADLDDSGAPAGARQVAGGWGDSAQQPQWAADGSLLFIAERTGWWNLYRLRDGQAEPLCPREAEFGVPLWQLGASTYAILDERRLLCCYCEHGVWRLATLDLGSGALAPYDLPFSGIGSLSAAGGRAIFMADSPERPDAAILLDLADGSWQELRRASVATIDPGYISRAEPIAFPTTCGQRAYGFFYPPLNRDYSGPDAERPPLLVMSHGGPTGATSAGLSLKIQYWTSRGIAVLDVNYGGSTGYGRAYRERLRDSWGIVDVDDCANGARHLAEQGRVDGGRLMITGGSAGGYTTLAALAFRDVFKAGASHYGIGDLEALARFTHKFESRYLDGLIGPYPARADLYHERSPLRHVGMLECPVAFFQGLEDKVVPPEQSESMVAALRAKGIPVAYLPFPGEQHGFRRAENIKRALEGELSFYSQIFGFPLADPIEPIPIMQG